MCSDRSTLKGANATHSNVAQLEFGAPGIFLQKILQQHRLRAWIRVAMSVPSKRVHTFRNIKIDEETVTEGTAVIRQPHGQVFYNPVQQFNRDLSVCAITAFQRIFLADAKLQKRHPEKTGIRILEALSATGLRSIRYANEIRGVDEILANDLDGDAVELIKLNVKDNGVGSIVKVSHGDAVYASMGFIQSSSSYHRVGMCCTGKRRKGGSTM